MNGKGIKVVSVNDPQSVSSHKVNATLAKILSAGLGLTFALGWGALAMLALQDFDRTGECLAQHTWFMLLVVLASAVGFGLILRKSLLGALIGAIIGINIQFLFLSAYSFGYYYWEPRPDAEKTPMVIAGPLLTGGDFAPEQLKGRLLLVDYWATWCPPCVAGIPHVKAMYDRYRADGLDVVGVSLDEDKERLEKFIADRGLTYPQVFYQKNIGHPLADKYNIQALPYIALIDPRTNLVLTSVANSRDLKWTVPAALDAIKTKWGQPADIANKRLATYSALPYAAGILGTLLGSLGEWLFWRRFVNGGTLLIWPDKKKLRRVK